MDEELLAGGNASGAVVRVGDTVRKPWLPTTPRTIDYLAHLAQAGVDVPRVHGRDEHGRLVLEYVPGVLAMDRAPLDCELVHRVGALVRRIHEASVGFPLAPEWPVLLPAPDPETELVCHNDLATWNLLIDGDRLVFIDWDGAGPSSRSWDLAYSAIAFGHLFHGSDVAASADRLAAFVDGYEADEGLRDSLPGTMVRRSRAMWTHLRQAHAAGFEPWATMFVEGHGDHWAATTEFIAKHQDEWAHALACP